MKVRCIQLLDSRGSPVQRMERLKLGHVYHVLEIWIEPGRTLLRPTGEEPTPALFQHEMFEVVSSVIPSTWVITSPTPGCLCLRPEPWNRPGFWDDFFDDEPGALECFAKERQKIIDSDP
jgi:hypothetical protein